MLKKILNWLGVLFVFFGWAVSDGISPIISFITGGLVIQWVLEILEDSGTIEITDSFKGKNIKITGGSFNGHKFKKINNSFNTEEYEEGE